MTQTSDLTPEALPAGQDGVLMRFSLLPRPDAMAAAERLAAELDRDPPEGTVEVVPGLVSVLLRFDPARARRAELLARGLARAQQIARGPLTPPDPARRWTIPVAFGGSEGPHLAQLAQDLGLSAAAAVEDICAAPLHILTIGFAPGQPYIGLLPERWNIPRLADLTPQVPAGAVVVAVRQIVLFGAASATGWRQVGQSALRCFRPDRSDPTPLRSGDAIRFAPVAAGDLAALEDAPDGLGGARLEVLR